MTPRIRDLGHDVGLSVYYGLQGSRLNWKGMTCYPSYSSNYGADVLIPNAFEHFGVSYEKASLADVVGSGLIITLGDVWAFETPLLNQMCVASWVPVDHLDVPAVTRGWFRMSGAVPVAMSKFGRDVLTEAGYSPLYVPHGIDMTVFRPGDKAAARERAGIPADAFVVGMVANNNGKDGNRKAFAEQITAFAELRAKHSDAFMFLHTDVDVPSGQDLRTFLQNNLPQGSYSYTDPLKYRRGLDASAVADVHRAADVLSNCSWGEGFGIPIIEAQACGTPVVVTDATAMPELVGAGWKVRYERLWHESQYGWASKPIISAIADAYFEAYEKARDETMRADAYAFAQDYDADRVVDRYWKPALAQLETALEETAAEARKPKKRREQIREADGLFWVDRGWPTGDSLGFGAHEGDLRLGDLLPEGGVFLDVGAHVGHWSLRLAKKAAHVFAVEANPATAKTLRRNVAMNGLDNVTVIAAAAWDETTTLQLEDPVGQTEGGSTRVLAGDGGVLAMPLDGLLSQYDIRRLDLIKMDVEGADLHALRGMRGLLRDHQPVLFIECHDVYGYYKREDLENLLTDLGYGWEIAASAMTDWMPDGSRGDYKQCDWLVARPVPGNVT
jgi:FkbM family methyltransferase